MCRTLASRTRRSRVPRTYSAGTPLAANARVTSVVSIAATRPASVVAGTAATAVRTSSTSACGASCPTSRCLTSGAGNRLPNIDGLASRRSAPGAGGAMKLLQKTSAETGRSRARSTASGPENDSAITIGGASNHGAAASVRAMSSCVDWSGGRTAGCSVKPAGAASMNRRNGVAVPSGPGSSSAEGMENSARHVRGAALILSRVPQWRRHGVYAGCCHQVIMLLPPAAFARW